MLTPQQLYAFDVAGWATVPDAIELEALRALNAAAARCESRAEALARAGSLDDTGAMYAGVPLLQQAEGGGLLRASFFDVLDTEPGTLPLVANPRIAAHVLSSRGRHCQSICWQPVIGGPFNRLTIGQVRHYRVTADWNFE